MDEEETSKDATFLEIFAGEAGLTNAVKRAGLPCLKVLDIHRDTDNVIEFDLAKQEPFKKLKKLLRRGRVRWLHLAPPCKTFSKARRRDRFARVKQLRSRQCPEGCNPKPAIVREANLLASRSAQLAKIQLRANGWFSIENPASSLLWLYKPIQLLAKQTGVKVVTGDQCLCGGEYGQRRHVREDIR